VTEPTPGTSPVPAPTTPATIVPPTPAPAPAPAPLPAKPASIEIPVPSNLLEENDPQKVLRRWDNMRGQMQAAQAQWEAYSGRLLQDNATLQDQVATLQARIQALTGEKTQLEQKVQALPATEQRANLADTLQAQLARYGAILTYPQLVAQVRVTEETQTDGTKVTKRSNPMVDLALSSTKSGAEFLTMLEGLAAQVSSVPAGAQPPPASPALGPTTPPTPAPADALGDLRRRADEAQLAGNYAESEKLWDEYQKMKTKK